MGRRLVSGSGQTS